MRYLAMFILTFGVLFAAASLFLHRQARQTPKLSETPPEVLEELMSQRDRAFERATASEEAAAEARDQLATLWAEANAAQVIAADTAARLRDRERELKQAREDLQKTRAALNSAIPPDAFRKVQEERDSLAARVTELVRSLAAAEESAATRLRKAEVRAETAEHAALAKARSQPSKRELPLGYRASGTARSPYRTYRRPSRPTAKPPGELSGTWLGVRANPNNGETFAFRATLSVTGGVVSGRVCHNHRSEWLVRGMVVSTLPADGLERARFDFVLAQVGGLQPAGSVLVRFGPNRKVRGNHLTGQFYGCLSERELVATHVVGGYQTKVIRASRQ